MKRIGLVMLLLFPLFLSPVFAQSGDGESGERARQRLRQVLLEADLDPERIEATMRATEQFEWGSLSEEGVESILPAIGYAKREGNLPDRPGELEAYARALAVGGSQLTRLGFTSREAARTLVQEVRRVGVEKKRPNASRADRAGGSRGAQGRGAQGRGAQGRAQRDRIRSDVRDRLEEVRRGRGASGRGPAIQPPGPPVNRRPTPREPANPGRPDTPSRP